MSMVKEHSFNFNQYRDLLSKIKTSLKEIGYYSVTPGDMIAAEKFTTGLCNGLSAKFMIVERHFGPGGGKQYFDWLNTTINSYMKNAQINDSDPKNIQNKLLMQYHRQFLYTELESILEMHFSQNIKIHHKEISDNIGGLARLLKRQESEKTTVDIYLFMQEVKEKSVSGKISNNDLISVIEKYVGGNNKRFKDSMNRARKKGENESYLINGILDNLADYHAKKNGRYDKDSKQIALPTDKITSDVFGEMLGFAINSEKVRANSHYGGVLLDNGLVISGAGRSLEDRRVEMKTNIFDSNMKLNLLLDSLETVKSNSYVKISSLNHEMAISVNLDENNNPCWTFFDPNFGGKSYNNHADFKKGVHDSFNETKK